LFFPPFLWLGASPAHALPKARTMLNYTIFALALTCLTTRVNELLFHRLAQNFSVVASFLILMIVWNSRRRMEL